MKKAIVGIIVGVLAMASVMTVSASEGWNQNQTGWWHEDIVGSYPVNNWKQVNGTWYYFDNVGYMKTGWIQLGDNWYYLRSDGAMHTGWLESNGKWYYLHESGAMAYSTTIGAYNIDASGAWLATTTNNNGKTENATEKYPLKLSYDNTRSWEKIDRLAVEYYGEYRDEVQLLLLELNKIRSEAGVPPVKLDENMTLAATARSIHMVSNDYFEHFYKGENQATYIANRYGFKHNGEVVTIGEGRYSVNVLEYLMWNFQSSPAHYDIVKLLSSKSVGIGLVPTDKGLYLTVIFSK